MINNTYRVYCQWKTLVVIPDRVDLFDFLNAQAGCVTVDGHSVAASEDLPDRAVKII